MATKLDHRLYNVRWRIQALQAAVEDMACAITDLCDAAGLHSSACPLSGWSYKPGSGEATPICECDAHGDANG